MNHPDIDKIISDIATLIEGGMAACLNVDTGEIVYTDNDSSENDTVEVKSEAYEKALARWNNKLEIMPVDLEDEQEIIDNFITDHVHVGTPLYKRLTKAKKQGQAEFNREIALCKGSDIWQKYHNNAIHSIVVCEIVEALGTPFVKRFPLNSDTLKLMVEAHVSNRYFYVTGNTVIISQVVDQTRFEPDSDEWGELDTNYTIPEWALKYAEEHVFHQMGGGLVYDPIDMYDKHSAEDIDMAKIERKIKNAISWADEEDLNFAEFCASRDNKDDDLFGPSTDYPEDYFGPELEFFKRIENIRETFDGKYPIPGKPDDEFSEEAPWKYYFRNDDEPF